MTTSDNMTILLVEDDDVAAEAVMRSLNKAGIQFPVVWAEDGIDGLDILRGRHATRKVPRPRLLLVDLNMPRMNGIEFLHELRADSALKDEVVFVLTTSDDDNDRSRAYEENVAGYMVKSNVGPQFAKLVSLLQSYQSAVKLP
jgi:CheY-like chemotaxis protein